MRLRTTLFLVMLAALVLPWAAWQLVLQMEALLREGHEQAQIASAHALALAVAATVTELPPANAALYVHDAVAPIFIDGSGDDWGEYPGTRSVAGGATLALASDAHALYALLDVDDATRARADAGNPLGLEGDRVEVLLRDAFGQRSWTLGNAAPGDLQVAGAAAGPVGQWQETPTGYRIELRLPRPAAPASLALVLVDADTRGARRSPAYGSTDEPLALLGSDPLLARALAALAPERAQLRVVSSEGWVLARAGALPTPSADAPDAPGGRPPLARAALSRAARPAARGQPRIRARATPPRRGGRVAGPFGRARERSAREWRHRHRHRRSRGAARARRRGARRTAARATGRRAARAREPRGVRRPRRKPRRGAARRARRIGYSGMLSWRIRRLRNAAERALRPDGRIDPHVPLLQSRDDLGDLARSFARLLGEIGAYTDYLRTLGSKLSHELNTPLAIVRSSLDNLEHEQLSDGARVYAERARAGGDRLIGILRAMSEASRVERAIASAEGEDFDLAELVRGSADAYRDLVAPRRLELDAPIERLGFHGAPDLIAQALDKLIDNARSFAPPDGWIRLALRRVDDAVELAVSNQGPLLPERMGERVFDSLVSVRDPTAARDPSPHLGLGLFIVRLVAELHGGEARAANRPAGDGVDFTLRLRGMQRARI